MDTWDSLPSECRCAPAKAFLQLYNATALPLSSGHSFNKKINQMSFSFTYAALLYINVSPLSPLSAPIALLTIDNAQLNCSEQTSVLLSSALSSSEKQKPYFCIFWPRKMATQRMFQKEKRKRRGRNAPPPSKTFVCEPLQVPRDEAQVGRLLVRTIATPRGHVKRSANESQVLQKWAGERERERERKGKGEGKALTLLFFVFLFFFLLVYLLLIC